MTRDDPSADDRARRQRVRVPRWRRALVALATLVVVSTLVVLVVGGATVTPSAEPAATIERPPVLPSPTGGDPHGAILRSLVALTPVVVPDEHRIPWYNDLPWPLVPNITVAEPLYDSCDGTKGTFGWDNANVVAYFQWSSTVGQLRSLLNQRLVARGFTLLPPGSSVPAWVDQSDGWTWVGRSSSGHRLAVDLNTEDNGEYHHVPLEEIVLEAPPDGRAPSGC